MAEPNEWEAANAAARRDHMLTLPDFYLRCGELVSCQADPSMYSVLVMSAQ